MIVVCSLQGKLFWESDGIRCPECNYETLRPATEWEMFMGYPLTLEQENDVRNRLTFILKQVKR
jgi:hypothetical protein